MRLAYMALLAYATEQGMDLNKIGGEYTPMQELFLGFCADWCASGVQSWSVGSNDRSHSPSRFRANGVLVNMPSWQSLRLQAGSPWCGKSMQVW